MYSIIACVTISIIVGLVLAWRDESYRPVSLTTVMAAMVGVLVGVMLSLIASGLVPQATWQESTWKLASMRSTDDTRGVFIFGSGSIRGETVYRVMLKRDDGSFSPFSVDADSSTRIIEDETLSDEGVMTIHVTGPDRRFAGWVLERTEKRTYTFRVPKGTVRNTFTVQ